MRAVFALVCIAVVLGTVSAVSVEKAKKHHKKVATHHDKVKPTVFAVLSSMAHIKSRAKLDDTPFKCNADGSVSMECEAPAQCPPCAVGAHMGKYYKAVRILEYPSGEYPFGTPTVLDYRLLTPRTTQRIRQVLSGELKKKMAEWGGREKIEKKEIVESHEAEELANLDKLKELVKYKHLTQDEKIIKALENVLEKLGSSVDQDGLQSATPQGVPTAMKEVECEPNKC